jgi:hypothetical protein
MSSKQEKHRTIFAPGLGMAPGVNHSNPDHTQGLSRSESWLSRRASQESSMIPSQRSVRVHSQIKTFDNSPFHEHKISYQTDLAGPVQICANKRTKKVVAIKSVPECTKSMIQRLKPAIHESIVQFSAAYHFQNSIYLVYERMLVSLAEIATAPPGHLPDTAIASASLSVLRGLTFIHDDLQMTHGAINSENILLNSLGQVKIGKYRYAHI